MKKNLTLTFRSSTIITIIISLLLGGVAGYFIRPDTSTDRTISVEGLATLKVEPDVFVFYPSVSAQAPTSDEAKDAVTAKSAALTSAVKTAGVQDSQLKSDLNVYENFKYSPDDADQTPSWQATYSLTITLDNADLVDEVADAIASVSGVEGNLQPNAQLSKEKSEEIKNQIRTEAIASAKKQAEQTAKDLGKKVVDVVSVEDVTNEIFFGQPYGNDIVRTAETSIAAAPTFTGQQEVEYRVKATFSIK